MEVKIDKLDNLGRGITYINNKICFIPNVLPNEIVEIEITKENKKYYEAKCISIKETSPFRITEECPYSSICGGCQLNHLCYNEENRFKTNKLRDLLFKYAHIEKDIIEPIKYQERNYYRNKITLHGNDEKLGIYGIKTNDIIPIQECLLVNKKINEIIKYLIKNNINIEEAIIKSSNDEDKIMISIHGEINNKEELISKCDVVIINGEYLSNEKRIITNINKIQYQESKDSFFQINKTLTEELYEEIKNSLKEKDINNALDLYCGTGSITIYISDYCKKIIGIDYNKSNIEDAIINKELNQKDNIDFICDKVENRIDSFTDIDLIIVDPPRSGLDKKTINNIIKIAPKQIIYVSCEPITLARDLNSLQELYKVIKVKPFNMFPRTYHVECISVLERKNVEK